MVRAPCLRVDHDKAVGRAESTRSLHRAPPLLGSASESAQALKLFRGDAKRDNGADIRRGRHDWCGDQLSRLESTRARGSQRHPRSSGGDDLAWFATAARAARLALSVRRSARVSPTSLAPRVSRLHTRRRLQHADAAAGARIRNSASWIELASTLHCCSARKLQLVRRTGRAELGGADQRTRRGRLLLRQTPPNVQTVP